jgi:hypothetical protein
MVERGGAFARTRHSALKRRYHPVDQSHGTILA